MNKMIAILVFLLCSAGLLAEPPRIKTPETISGHVGGFIVLRAETDGPSVVFYPIDAGLNVFPQELLVDKKATVVTASHPGRYRILCYTGNQDGPSLPSITTVIVSSPQPGPTPPEPSPPPTPPEPSPVPPNPEPTPKLAPIPEIKGLAVLIVEESEDRNKLPAGQRAIILGRTARNYLDSKCDTDPERPDWKSYRIWDQHEVLDGVHPVWVRAMNRPRKSVPWLIVSNGSRNIGYEGPLPSTVDEFIKLLSQYEGQ